jgi:hypothetical protein
MSTDEGKAIWYIFISDKVQRHHLDIVERIFECDTTFLNQDRISTAFRKSVISGRATITAKILALNPTRGAINDGFIYASRHGQFAIVDMILQSKQKPDEDAINSAFFGALMNGHTAILELILQLKPRLNRGTIFSALLIASEGGRAAVVELILQLEGKPDQDVINIALIKATKNGHNSVVQWITEHLKSIKTY